MSLPTSNHFTLPLSSQGRLEHLDWLRAVAIIAVVLGHSNPTMAPGGAVGVSIFFALSGYLIGSILLREGFISARNLLVFFARRVARIYPMYAITIALLCGLFLVKEPARLKMIAPDLIKILTFTGEPSQWAGIGFGVLWTLAVEFWFYLTFPILAWIAKKLGMLMQIFTAAIVVSIIAKILQLGGNTLMYYDHFLLGAIAFVAKSPTLIDSQRSAKWMLYIGLLILSISLIFPYPGSRNLVWHGQSLLAAAGTCLVIYHFQNHPTTATMPALAFIGRISFSVYLVHAALLDAFPRFPSNIPIYLVVVTLFSTMTFYLIEQPVSKWVHSRLKYDTESPSN